MKIRYNKSIWANLQVGHTYELRLKDLTQVKIILMLPPRILVKYVGRERNKSHLSFKYKEGGYVHIPCKDLNKWEIKHGKSNK